MARHLVQARAERCTVGFSVHTGWAVAVAIVGSASAPDVVVRRRIELIGDPETAAVYHAAEKVPLVEATRLVERATAEALSKATLALDALAEDCAGHAPLEAA